MNINKTKLLTHLTNRQTFYEHSLVIWSVLGGLIAAVRRGDFDTEDKK